MITFDVRVLPSPSGVQRVVLHGDLDAVPARSLAEVLSNCGAPSDPLMVDAQDLGRVSVAGLRVLAHEAARRRRRGGAMHIMRAPDAVLVQLAGAGLLGLTRIDLQVPSARIPA